jgi:tRNA pseudouridine38-40 synthase
VTVQGELVKALCRWSGEAHTQHTVQFSGRTDRGVHSYGQIVQFSTDRTPRVEHINKCLPPDIVLWALCAAPTNFSPRNSVLARHYRYYLDTSNSSLNIIPMIKACNSLIGTNDYALLSKPDDERSTWTTILNISLSNQQNCFVLDIIGTSFLWKLVRKIVTLLLLIGQNKLETDIIARLITGDAALPGGINPAPPESLVLVESIVPFQIYPNKIAVNNIRKILKEKSGFYQRTATTLLKINDDYLFGLEDWA